MWPDPVAVLPPGLDQPARLCQQAEHVLVQAFVPQTAVEDLHERIPQQLARCDVVPSYPWLEPRGACQQGLIVKALGMLVLGVALGTVGQDMESGTERYTFGQLELAEGLEFVAMAMHLFGICEILRNLEDERERTALVKRVDGLVLRSEDLRHATPPALRGTALGSALGIPSNPVMALVIGALTVQGITPGPNGMQNQPELFWSLIASMWIGNGILLVLNLPLIGLWVRLLTVPYQLLFPAIIGFCCIGALSVANNSFHVFALLVFGLGGYGLTKLGFELTPLLLGFVIGPMLEANLRRPFTLSARDSMIFLERPVAASLLAIAVATLAVLALPGLRRKRAEAFVKG